MAPTKRARPSFSPPRPGKSKPGKTASSATKKQKATASARKPSGPQKRKGGRPVFSDGDGDEDSEGEEEEIRSRPISKAKSKSKGKATARSFIMDEASASDEEEEPDEDEDPEEETTPELSTFLSRPGDSASPEPDIILAEIEVNQPSQSPIPEALIHKILSHHFTKEGVKMSRDARDLVTKYIEVFVREAIMRSAYERQEKEKDGGGGGGGFLEVEDLERAAVQLCLDF